MKAFLDTSVVVRYLTGLPPDAAEVAGDIIDRENELVLTDVALAEVAHVLISHYRLSREAIVDHLIALVEKDNIEVLDRDKGVMIDALLLCRPSARVSFPDAFIWAAGRFSGARTVYSFDRRFPPEGIDVRRSRTVA